MHLSYKTSHTYVNSNGIVKHAEYVKMFSFSVVLPLGVDFYASINPAPGKSSVLRFLAFASSYARVVIAIPKQ